MTLLSVPPPAVSLGRVALLPASLLSHRDRWQPVVDTLALDTMAILQPPPGSRLRATLDLVAVFLQALGHRVAALEADRFLVPPPPETQGQLFITPATPTNQTAAAMPRPHRAARWVRRVPPEPLFTP